MEKNINQDEINALLANEIRKNGLDDAIKLDVVREKVMKKIQEMSQGITEMENPAVAQGPTNFPNPEEDEEQFHVAPNVNQNYEVVPKIGLEAGAQSLDVSIDPKTAIIPEVPDFLRDVEPGKIFVYDFNELSVGGENLSNKPFKTMGDPNISKSMQQMWSENGITKTEVFQTKFEKIGEIVFDYKSGSSQFIERRFEPDFDIQQQYKQNPYAAEPEKEIENYLRNTVDLDSKINDVITNIVKSYFLTNTERAIEPIQNITPENPIQNATLNTPGIQNNYPISENIELSIKSLIDNFKKIDTPKDLIESIKGVSKRAKLVYEDKEIKKWILNDKEYYFPNNPMSVKKCYVK